MNFPDASNLDLIWLLNSRVHFSLFNFRLNCDFNCLLLVISLKLHFVNALSSVTVMYFVAEEKHCFNFSEKLLFTLVQAQANYIQIHLNLNQLFLPFIIVILRLNIFSLKRLLELFQSEIFKYFPVDLII